MWEELKKTIKDGFSEGHEERSKKAGEVCCDQNPKRAEIREDRSPSRWHEGPQPLSAQQRGS